MHDAATNPDALVRSAVSHLNDGNAAAAETQCRAVLAHRPQHLGALNVLGLALYLEARHGEAEETFATLVELQPDEPTHWINLATARRGGKRFEQALAAYARAAQLGAASADFFYNIGLTHIDRCDFEAARAVLQRAIELAPDDAEARFQYAQACYECLRTEEAQKALEGWQQWEGLAPDLLANIGYLLMNLGAQEDANEALGRAAREAAADSKGLLTLARALERTNRLDEAKALLARLDSTGDSSSIDEDLVPVRAQLAQRESHHDVAVRLFEQMLRARPEFHLRHFQLFPLAKSLDALGRYEEAFAALQDAHCSQVEHLKLTAPGLVLRGAPPMAITQFGCDPNDVAAWNASDAPSAAQSPIFIVAFPRSGTTLLELTLDAHPQLCSMDEQPFLQNALDDLIACGVRYPAELGRLTRAQLAATRDRYWERVRGKVRLDTGQRLVDKNPLNILRLPVIRRLFPNARIVLAVRHPCDVLLSCYGQHFRAPDFALLCRDLPTLATAYRRTFDFWYEQVTLLQPSVREVRYESFVADFDQEVRSLAAFLDLPWDDGMLGPAEHALSKGFISTPSYAQVVQPVYRKAVGRWKHYERHFAAVLPVVRPYLERWGYEA